MQPGNVFYQAVKKKAREDWQEQLAKAVKDGQQPDDELLEGFTDEFSEKEWQWYQLSAQDKL